MLTENSRDKHSHNHVMRAGKWRNNCVCVFEKKKKKKKIHNMHAHNPLGFKFDQELFENEGLVAGTVLCVALPASRGLKRKILQRIEKLPHSMLIMAHVITNN